MSSSRDSSIDPQQRPAPPEPAALERVPEPLLLEEQAQQAAGMQRVVTLHKGRGAVSNLQGRYELDQRGVFDDGWGQGGEAPRLVTEVAHEHAKSILSRNASPDVPFSVSLNPYRGCEHGCIYCFARPTHSYLGFRPGSISRVA